MADLNNGVRLVVRNILKDIRVELSDEFDKNFERQAFFSEHWARRRSPQRPGGATLIDTGALRRSIQSRVSEDGISFFSDLPYAGIHNEGGEIKVTARMKRYFWYRYMSMQKAFGRKKNGELRKDKRTVRLSTEAEFWKCMALMRKGSTIKIPRRQFLGASPEVETAVREIIEDNLAEYFGNEYKIQE